MKKSIIIPIILIIFTFGTTVSVEGKFKVSGKEKRKILKQLDPKHKKWFNMVTYISTKDEKNVFLLLKNDRDRDLFIKSFWLQRDPTPGTPINEYKREIHKRFAYASTQFRRGASRPGWLTDMGKFYMILGKPNSINRFDSKAGLYPAQVWYYYGDKRKGLPTYFNITFFKPRNTTEWKLYSPAQNGPQALLINWDPVDTQDFNALYKKIKELAPGLADPAVSMVPNDQSPGLSPSLRANLILSNIYESPKRNINANYATNFLNYKGFVDINSSINYIENTHSVRVYKYPRFNFSFVNISIKPKMISLGYSKKNDKYFFNFKLTVSLKKGDKFIYQYSKNFDFYVEEKNVGAFRKGVEIHDIFPIAPGEYKLVVFVQNTIGKQFSYFDNNLKVSGPESPPFLTKPVVGYKIEKQPDNFFFPYYLNGSKLFFDTEKVFKVKSIPILYTGAYGLTEQIWKNGRIEYEVFGLGSRNKFKSKKTIKLNEKKYVKNMNITVPITDSGLFSDYYRYTVKLIGNGKNIIDSKSGRFTIAPTANVNYPFETFKRSRIENPYYFDYILGIQYENLGNTKSAVSHFEKAVTDNPGFTEGKVRLLLLLIKMKEYTKVLVKAEEIKNSEKYRFEYRYIKGSALFGMKNYEKALSELLAANKIYNSDLRVLNLLGYTFFNLKEYKEAKKVLNSSISLDKNQPLIKDMIRLVNKKLDVK